MSAYRDSEGLRIYESAMALPYFEYLKLVLPRLLRQYAIAPGTSLDVACGGGHLAEFLHHQGWEAYGCDLSPDMLGLARQSYPQLSERFFAADMCAVPRDRQYDLVTLVFNSIHYLDPQQRARFWAQVGGCLRSGGYFISQQNTWEAMQRYWLGRTHRWESAAGFAFWTGRVAARQDATMIEKQYFERTADATYRLATVVHPYYFFKPDEMRQALAPGIAIVALLDATSLTSPTARSNAIWVVARKERQEPGQVPAVP